MKRNMLVVSFVALTVLRMNNPLVFAADGIAKGETTDEKGQQGLGLGSGASSNVIMGGPDMVEGPARSAGAGSGHGTSECPAMDSQ